ncbi:MAG: rhodanese-related sulfurtransferase [Pseudomonadota bacterium]
MAAFYKFVAEPLGEAELGRLRAELEAEAARRGLLGTVLLAPEGINGSLDGEPDELDGLLAWLRAWPAFADLGAKYSGAHPQRRAFARLRVKLKAEIVSFGPATAPGTRTGIHVGVDEWHRLLDDPDVVVIDTRNGYEIEVGGFAGAVDPGTANFREFPRYVAEQLDPEQPVAMFCTGGIRCEKASSYLLQQGFERVYQLDGGVLQYLESADPATSRWQGDCFVFDQRVSLTPDLAAGDFEQCHACRRPLSVSDREHPDYREGVSCRRCVVEVSGARLAGLSERQRQIELAAERGERHLGPDAQPGSREDSG